MIPNPNFIDTSMVLDLGRNDCIIYLVGVGCLEVPVKFLVDGRAVGF